MYLKQDFKCPKCNNKSRIKVYQSLTDKDLDKIYNESIIFFTCPNCGEKIHLNYDLKYITDKCHVYLSINKDQVKDEFNPARLTYTYDDFKEKILIFNNDLNDMVICFLKCFIYDSIENKNDFKEIRFNNLENDNLVFYVIGLNQYAKVPLDFYYNLLNKGKFKKVKDCIVVDEGNFRCYFKVR